MKILLWIFLLAVCLYGGYALRLFWWHRFGHRSWMRSQLTEEERQRLDRFEHELNESDCNDPDEHIQMWLRLENEEPTAEQEEESELTEEEDTPTEDSE